MKVGSAVPHCKSFSISKDNFMEVFNFLFPGGPEAARKENMDGRTLTERYNMYAWEEKGFR